jgi:hypothetical protein
MATFEVRHSEFPRNPKKFTVVLDKVVKNLGEPDTIFPEPGDDDVFWEIRIGVADAVDVSGETIKSLWVDTAVEGTVDATIQRGINEISQLIDWSDNGEFIQEDDIYGPVVVSTFPSPNAKDVSIFSSIQIRLQDFLPAKGIDLSTIKLTVDGVQVTPDFITGHIFDTTVSYKPPAVFEEREDSP